MNRAEYLLTQAASECNEVAHRITKAMHFGVGEIQPGQELTNAERVVAEYIDLCAVMEMLEAEGLIALPSGAARAADIAAKKAKVEKFILYAKHQCGTVTE